jgi:hypothetical protein
MHVPFAEPNAVSTRISHLIPAIKKIHRSIKATRTESTIEVAELGFLLLKPLCAETREGYK